MRHFIEKRELSLSTQVEAFEITPEVSVIWALTYLLHYYRYKLWPHFVSLLYKCTVFKNHPLTVGRNKR